MIASCILRNYPTPTEADLSVIGGILSRITITKKDLPNFAQGDYATGGHLSKKYTGWRPTGCCTSERRTLHDKLRTLAGYTYARKVLVGERLEVRLATCKTCPAYHENTVSCGRLILDALNPIPVEIDGQMVNPCGCATPLKAMWKSESCPANRWP